ncbi:hypothetical protein B4102_2451 [Heyndrickxia sporothermodurans]|uniref:Uncharacterized protein n=1 Tax=Heyndrickxia sporothermodurans TaxID=46224 RepID=A0A150LCI1_9BACI|nr:hypothetical protein B4102_2451 [Heyndrickxia sporothermodurans]
MTDFQYIQKIFQSEEFTKINSKSLELEVETDKISLLFNQLANQNIKFNVLYLGNKGSQQIYEDLYEGSGK